MSWVAVAIGGAAVVGAGASAYSSHKQSKAADKQLKLEKDQIEAQKGLTKDTLPYGKSYLEQSQQALRPTLGYYQSLLRGDRSAVQERLAPEMNSVANRYQGAYTTQRSLYPRGGMSTAATQDLPYKQIADQNNLIFQQRPQAAQSLAALGPSLGSLGMNAYGLNSNIQNNLFNQGQTSYQNQMGARQSQLDSGMAAGQGLFNAWQAWQNRPQTAYVPSSTYSGGVAGTGATGSTGGFGPGNVSGVA